MVIERLANEVYVLSENAIKMAYRKEDGTIAVVQLAPIAQIDFNQDSVPEVNLYRIALLFDWAVIQDAVAGEYAILIKDKTDVTFGTGIQATMLWP